MKIALTDDHLLHAYRTGDKTAIDTLIQRYVKLIYRFAHARVRDTDEAANITQDIFMKMWKNLHRYREGASFKAWLFTIARNTIVDWSRKKREVLFSRFQGADGENLLITALLDHTADPHKQAIRKEEYEQLAHALSELSPAYREVVFLHYQEGLTFDEIGTYLGKSRNTTKSQHRRALHLLEKHMRAYPPHFVHPK